MDEYATSTESARHRRFSRHGMITIGILSVVYFATLHFVDYSGTAIVASVLTGMFILAVGLVAMLAGWGIGILLGNRERWMYLGVAVVSAPIVLFSMVMIIACVSLLALLAAA